MRVVDDSSPKKKKKIKDINNSQFYKYYKILNMKKQNINIDMLKR